MRQNTYLPKLHQSICFTLFLEVTSDIILVIDILMIPIEKLIIKFVWLLQIVLHEFVCYRQNETYQNLIIQEVTMSMIEYLLQLLFCLALLYLITMFDA